MNDLTPYLDAYGLTASDLSDTRRRQLGDILAEAGKAAAGTVLLKITEILTAEAQRQGKASGTPDSEAQRRAAEAAARQIEAEQERQRKARQTRNIIIGIAAAVVLGTLFLIIKLNRS